MNKSLTPAISIFLLGISFITHSAVLARDGKVIFDADGRREMREKPALEKLKELGVSPREAVNLVRFLKTDAERRTEIHRLGIGQSPISAETSSTQATKGIKPFPSDSSRPHISSPSSVETSASSDTGYPPVRPVEEGSAFDALEESGAYFKEPSLKNVALTGRKGRTLAAAMRSKKGFTFNMERVTENDVAAVVRFLKRHRKVTSLKIKNIKLNILTTALEALRTSAVRFNLLRDLDVSKNKVTAQFIELCAQVMPSITSLNVRESSLGSPEVAAISRMTTLTSLNISDNHGVGSAGAEIISGMANLKSLKARHTNLRITGIREISRMTNLTSLDISFMSLGDEAAEIIRVMPNLTLLEIRSNNITPAGAGAISRMNSLKSLNIRFNNLGPAGAQAISWMRNLTLLEIGNNDIGPAGVEAISTGLPNLKSLSIPTNNIGDAGAAAISTHMTQLESLDIANNNIGSAGAAAISTGLPNLKSLSIPTNNIGAAGAEAISRMVTLKSLDVSFNKIGASGAEWISRMSNLRFLDIRYNNLGDEGAEKISRMVNLQSLNITQNALGPRGEDAIRGMTHLDFVDFRNTY